MFRWTGRGSAISILVSVSVLLVSGCLGGSGLEIQQTTPSEVASHASSSPRIVVAVIDTGINPYHEAFRAPGFPNPSTVIPGLDPLEVIELNFEADYATATKRDPWDRLERNQLYWFKDTRVMGVSFGEWTSIGQDAMNGRPVLDEVGHGTATASLVAAANPHAIILMIEVGTPLQGFDWLLDRRWVDIVSLSSGVPGNPPLDDMIPGQDSYSWRTQAVERTGKLIFTAVGNEVNTCIFDQICGPPWVVAVGGVDPQSHGENIYSGKFPDFVSDFIARVADHNHTSNTHLDFGTSFATPIAAGVASAILSGVRERLDYAGGTTLAHVDKGITVTPQDLRRVLNATAVYWNTQEYNGTRIYPTRPIPTAFLASVPVLPELAGTSVGPWVQMGWGYVSPEIVDDAVAVLLGEEPWPEKPGAEGFMERAYGLRQTYWNLPRPG